MPAVKRFFVAAILAVVPLGLTTQHSKAAPPNRCTVSATSVVFGTYDRLTPSDLTALGGVTVTCTAAGPIAVLLSAGGSGSFAPRRMMAAGNFSLSYNLYLDQFCSRIWGNGTGGSQSLTTTSAASSMPFQIFGRIPAQQTTVRAGSYSDTIMVTVSF
jgi:spore coat protein U-like protein